MSHSITTDFSVPANHRKKLKFFKKIRKIKIENQASLQKWKYIVEHAPELLE